MAVLPDLPATVPQGAQGYLETVFEMEEEGGRIAQARIAKRMGLSAPTVSDQVRRLAKAGLVSVAKREIVLTAHGHSVATPLARPHRLAERLLVDGTAASLGSDLADNVWVLRAGS